MHIHILFYLIIFQRKFYAENVVLYKQIGVCVLHNLRDDIESYINTDNAFLTSLEPISVPATAPAVVKSMAQAGHEFGVGPMAAVAGAIAEKVAEHLIKFSSNVIVENGGDIYIFCERPIKTAIYAGDSPLSMKIGLELEPAPQGISVCTSSGKVGHSLSFGKADSVTVVAHDGSIADAAATSIGNIVKHENNLEQALDFGRNHKTILGLVIIINDRIGFFGETLKITKL